MTRPLKPDDQVTPESKKHREYYKNNLEALRKRQEYAHKYYVKNKIKHQFRKKAYERKVRDSHYEILGGKCASCGELFNPHGRYTNLQFDHKFYLRSKSMGNSALWQIRKLIEQGQDPSVQFMLLCRTCHMALTYLRKNKEKSKHVIELAKKLGVLE